MTTNDAAAELPKRSKKTKEFSSTMLFCCALPMVMMLGYWCDRPFSEVLSTKSVSLARLSEQQRMNITTAAASLDGIVIKPGEEFSFNGRVGPRTMGRGYVPARSYVGNDAPETIGGGICLVSSALYIDALTANLEVTQRVPHLRTIGSVPAGLDATVWYTGADLRFKNTLECPVEIATKYSDEQLTIQMRGHPSAPSWSASELVRSEHRIPGNRLKVEVFALSSGKTRLVSTDVYGIPMHGEHHQ